ncbi:MAG TPA: iron ABC transporter permease [Labilithrix sp.]|nr:iron ABC transporter permease [Labilithrix sp.]
MSAVATAAPARGVRPAAVLVGCAIALVLAIVIGASFGTDPVSVLTAIVDPTSRDHDIVFDVRLPRVLLAALAGAGLSVVGVALQALLRNPLAEPFVLGVSGGSALGATLAILMGLTGATVLGASLVPLAALAGGLGATILVHAFASAARESRGTSVLLSGIVVNSIASAAITFVKTLVVPAKAQELLFWLMGFLDVPSRASLVALAIYGAIGTGILLYDAARLNVLSLGDDAAAHLGVRVRAVEVRTMLASSLVVGAIVSVTGLIGFVGLIVPHALRRLLGPDTRILMPASLALGGAALVLCDLVSRGAFRFFHTEVPVGAVTALIGGPLFLVLLVRRRGL